MKKRTGEKIGWTAGWMGGFVWLFVLSLVFIFQGKTAPGLLGMGLFGLAVFTIFFFAPWRFTSIPYWKLMLAPYGVFILSVAWAVWSYGGLENLGLNWWNLLWILPMLTPLGIFNKKTWSDSTHDRPRISGNKMGFTI